MSPNDVAPQIITLTTVVSLLAVVAILAAALVASRTLLPRGSSAKDQAIFVWLAFDLLIHFIFEGSFLWLSCQAWPLDPLKAVNSSPGAFGELWREYAIADARWGTADETVVALELLTVFGAGPLCGWILWQLTKGDRGRHYWIIVLCTAEIYGGWMTFVPEWLIGSPALNTSHPMYTWLYLFFFNFLWVIIPAWLLYDSFIEVTQALRHPAAYAAQVEREERARALHKVDKLKVQ